MAWEGGASALESIKIKVGLIFVGSNILLLVNDVTSSAAVPALTPGARSLAPQITFKTTITAG